MIVVFLVGNYVCPLKKLNRILQKNRFTIINSRSNFSCLKRDIIFWFSSAKLWDKSGQNYDFSSYLKGFKIGSKLWVYRQITKNYGFEHPPDRRSSFYQTIARAVSQHFFRIS